MTSLGEGGAEPPPSAGIRALGPPGPRGAGAGVRGWAGPRAPEPQPVPAPAPPLLAPPRPPSPGSGRGFPVPAPPAPAGPPSPPVAGSADAGSEEASAEGRGRRRPGGRHRAAGQADPGELGPGRRESRLEGGTPGFPGRRGGRSPMGAGRRVDAASGSLAIPRVSCADILCPPLSCLSVPSVVAVRPRGFPPLSPSAGFPVAPFSSLAPVPVHGQPVF